MIIRNALQGPLPPSPCGLTIGNFDGLHLGHRFLLNTLRTKIGPGGTLCVITFTPHSSHFLRGCTPLLLSTDSRKSALLKEAGVDALFILPFIETLAATAYDTFLIQCKEALSFTHLILGEGACLGQGRLGTQEKIEALQEILDFRAHYLPKHKIKGRICSSRAIRHCLLEGDLERGSPATRTRR